MVQLLILEILSHLPSEPFPAPVSFALGQKKSNTKQSECGWVSFGFPLNLPKKGYPQKRTCPYAGHGLGSLRNAPKSVSDLFP